MRRPRDRKAQIVSAAAGLFYERGYHNVGTGDIAAAVGITAGALYRHFANKQDLLAHTLIDVFTVSTAEVLSQDAELTDIVERLAARAAGRRDLAVMWNRESRHLDEVRRQQLRDEFFAFLSAFRHALMRWRPELAEENADLLAWSALGTLTSSSYHRTELAEQALATLLREMATAVLTAPMATPAGATRPSGGSRGLRPRGRRESILAAATHQFSARGYWSVTMEDIGAEVGISGAAVYKHFESKVELLSAAIARASEPLQLGLTAALGSATTARQGLTNALGAYIDFALEHHDLVGILISEVPNLPEREQHSVRRAQHDYVSEWIRLLVDARPELDERTATFLVHGTLTMVNDASRTASLRRRSDLDAMMRMLGARVLGLKVPLEVPA